MKNYKIKSNKFIIHVTDNGIPYIKYEDIKAALSASTLAEFNEWFCGQTALLLDDGTTGIYPWDWDNFIAHTEGRWEFFD